MAGHAAVIKDAGDVLVKRDLFFAAGVTGKEHFEVLDGLLEGDEVVTGPHKTLRDLKDGALLQGKAEE